MQYRKLHRNIEIVVMDGEDLFGKGYFLPRGFLRDTPARLKKADLIVVNQAKNQERITQELAKYTDAPVVFMRMKIDADLKGKRVGLFCAIGKPDKFMESVRHCGAEIIATFFKRDHDYFSAEELEAFAKRSKADLLVCTEKDQVKLPSDLRLPILALEGELEFVSGKEHWDDLYDRRIQNHTS
jgi:tetraacyldisaccharide 4'-kinase